jgi:hypothetical protein
MHEALGSIPSTAKRKYLEIFLVVVTECLCYQQHVGKGHRS